MFDAIAREYGEGRLLLIGTTDLDAQRPVIWNIGALAASGKPEAAIAPMFQITGRCASRSVVPISSRRPFWYSRAIAASIFWSAYLAMISASGLVSAMASSNSAARCRARDRPFRGSCVV